MTKQTRRVVVVPPGREAYIKDDFIPTLEAMQLVVNSGKEGGCIAIITIRKDCTIYGDDNAVCNGELWNRWVHGHYCAGTLLVTGAADEEGEDTDMPLPVAEKLVRFFNTQGQDVGFLVPVPSSIEQLERWTGRPAFQVWECDENMKPTKLVK
jgi:hypothetical protein